MGRVNGDNRSFPEKDMHLALYMQHLNTAKHSKSAVEEVVHAQARVHKMTGIESPRVIIGAICVRGYEKNTKQA